MPKNKTNIKNKNYTNKNKKINKKLKNTKLKKKKISIKLCLRQLPIAMGEYLLSVALQIKIHSKFAEIHALEGFF